MSSVRARLVKDHVSLDALLVKLAEDAQATDRQALQQTWSDLEKRLIAHLDAEERYLLPLVEFDNPLEVARTRREHAEIRDLLAELGLAIELHTARQPDVQRLIDMLRAHAEHEESALYSLAGNKASSAVEHSIASTLKAVVRSALRVTGQGPATSPQNPRRAHGQRP